MIRAVPKGGPAAFCHRQASLLNRPSPSARPSIFPFEGGTIGFEVTSGLAAPFPPDPGVLGGYGGAYSQIHGFTDIMRKGPENGQK